MNMPLMPLPLRCRYSAAAMIQRRAFRQMPCRYAPLLLSRLRLRHTPPAPLIFFCCRYAYAADDFLHTLLCHIILPPCLRHDAVFDTRHA